MLHDLALVCYILIENLQNIEHDVHVALNISLTELQFTVIDELSLLWTEWSHHHSMSLCNLKMHKSPRMILHDPRQPCHDADKAVLQDFSSD
jgi:hypothetical protein